MLLTITTTHQPASDLGYLLAKNPARCQSFDLAHGQAHVFYPEVGDARCTAALLLDLDPVGLVRGRRHAEAGALREYVNDRPYVGSSFLSVALGRVFSSAMRGQSRERPELAATPIPLRAVLAAVPCRGGGEALLRRLFEPLGYAVDARRLELDGRFPEWGASPYFAVQIDGTARVSDLLVHLYVLLPVLDDDKHYWVGEDEIEKLLARGKGWLERHPERDTIVQRYLRRRQRLVRGALERLLADEVEEVEAAEVQGGSDEERLEAPLSLNEQRLGAVVDVLRELGARRILDLGCGEGKLLARLLQEPGFVRLVGVDVSPRALELAAARLHLDRLPPRVRERIELWQGALTYRDRRLAGFDVACAIEVVEHLDSERLPAFERCLFEFARPGAVVLTTPNVECNPGYGLPPGRLRHRDHRFEWTRAEFRDWVDGVAGRHGYAVEVRPIGPVDAEAGAPTQMAVFRR